MKNLLLILSCLIGMTIMGCADSNQAAPEASAAGRSLLQEAPSPSEARITPSTEGRTAEAGLRDEISPTPPAAPTAPNPEKVLLDVPLINQNPELKYGCEVTSLAMVLQYAGVETDKLKLAQELQKDGDPLKKNRSGDITYWGNPDHGFVGDITGKEAGYAVNAGPLEGLLKQYLQDRAINLTGKPFDDILAQVRNQKPVILWTTGGYTLPDKWESWKHEQEEIRAPLDLHAVVLVGFDPKHLYLNDPLTGKKSHRTDKEQFLRSWEALGQQALSYW